MNYTVEPWEVTGISVHGPYIKVRGTIPGGKWEMANVPFTANGNVFYGVKEAKEYAELIKFTPTMYRLIEAIAKNHCGIDIKEECSNIVKELENFKKYNY